jgi:hypothetical protein
LEAKGIMKIAKVYHFKFIFKAGFHIGQNFWVTASEDKVINIKNKDYDMASYFLGIDIRVRMTSRKDSIKKKVVHFGISSLRSLLKTIKRFLKVTNKAGVVLDIARRLFHVYLFLHILMKEG